MAGMGHAQLLGGLIALANWVVGLHVGGGQLGRYTGLTQQVGRKARMGRLGFGPYCLEN
jgi:hypothetical protein